MNRVGLGGDSGSRSSKGVKPDTTISMSEKQWRHFFENSAFKHGVSSGPDNLKYDMMSSGRGSYRAPSQGGTQDGAQGGAQGGGSQKGSAVFNNAAFNNATISCSSGNSNASGNGNQLISTLTAEISNATLNISNSSIPDPISTPTESN